MTPASDPFAAIRSRFLLRLADQRVELEHLSGDVHGNHEILGIAHRIAGIAGSLGFSDLSKAASEVEALIVLEPAAPVGASLQFKYLLSKIDAILTDN